MSAKTSHQAVYMQTRNWRSIRWGTLLRAMIFIASAGLLAWFINFLQQPGTLPINKIHALGSFNMVDEKMLREVVARTVAGGYFTVNVEEVQTAVEALPWVYKASVSRVWPDTISISVTEQKALAEWRGGGVVNQQGEIFKPLEFRKPVQLPEFDGPAGMERNMTEFYRVAKQIVEPLGLSITRLKMDSRRAYRLTLNNGIQVLLGREHIHDRLKRFSRVYKKVLVTRAEEIARVDTRYSNGLAIGWRKQVREKG